ncbi:hypothetical protein BDZ90DRAFT_262474 [Jaminaea rosea]|uniref:Uncharacterized protein n=1 Tax=Jaminaea rosea TaxID=1569628 RepID=A0A316UQM2_9BASI|nr:hypothetical protein BDZ90DRAFT_262474 [Jaminaea rosea]PWN25425.1 hypothetical protein BDZ90DRAFT_262474 [Jaminaea rosea]
MRFVKFALATLTLATLASLGQGLPAAEARAADDRGQDTHSLRSKRAFTPQIADILGPREPGMAGTLYARNSNPTCTCCANYGSGETILKIA